MGYVDGFVLPVSKKDLAAYKRVARKAGKIFLEHGALEYRECVGDDLNIKTFVSFPERVRMKRGENVVFGWVAYKSRAHRDRVNAKVIKDPRLADIPMLFDLKRMLWGGFKVLVAV